MIKYSQNPRVYHEDDKKPYHVAFSAAGLAVATAAAVGTYKWLMSPANKTGLGGYVRHMRGHVLRALQDTATPTGFRISRVMSPYERLSRETQRTAYKLFDTAVEAENEVLIARIKASTSTIDKRIDTLLRHNLFQNISKHDIIDLIEQKANTQVRNSYNYISEQRMNVQIWEARKNAAKAVLRTLEQYVEQYRIFGRYTPLYRDLSRLAKAAKRRDFETVSLIHASLPTDIQDAFEIPAGPLSRAAFISIKRRALNTRQRLAFSHYTRIQGGLPTKENIGAAIGLWYSNIYDQVKKDLGDPIKAAAESAQALTRVDLLGHGKASIEAGRRFIKQYQAELNFRHSILRHQYKAGFISPPEYQLSRLISELKHGLKAIKQLAVMTGGPAAKTYPYLTDYGLNIVESSDGFRWLELTVGRKDGAHGQWFFPIVSKQMRDIPNYSFMKKPGSSEILHSKDIFNGISVYTTEHRQLRDIIERLNAVRSKLVIEMPNLRMAPDPAQASQEFLVKLLNESFSWTRKELANEAIGYQATTAGMAKRLYAVPAFAEMINRRSGRYDFRTALQELLDMAKDSENVAYIDVETSLEKAGTPGAITEIAVYRPGRKPLYIYTKSFASKSPESYLFSQLGRKNRGMNLTKMEALRDQHVALLRKNKAIIEDPAQITKLINDYLDEGGRTTRLVEYAGGDIDKLRASGIAIRKVQKEMDAKSFADIFGETSRGVGALIRLHSTYGEKRELLRISRNVIRRGLESLSHVNELNIAEHQAVFDAMAVHTLLLGKKGFLSKLLVNIFGSPVLTDARLRKLQAILDEPNAGLELLQRVNARASAKYMALAALSSQGKKLGGKTMLNYISPLVVPSVAHQFHREYYPVVVDRSLAAKVRVGVPKELGKLITGIDEDGQLVVVEDPGSALAHSISKRLGHSNLVVADAIRADFTVVVGHPTFMFSGAAVTKEAAASIQGMADYTIDLDYGHSSLNKLRRYWQLSQFKQITPERKRELAELGASLKREYAEMQGISRAEIEANLDKMVLEIGAREGAVPRVVLYVPRSIVGSALIMPSGKFTVSAADETFSALAKVSKDVFDAMPSFVQTIEFGRPNGLQIFVLGNARQAVTTAEGRLQQSGVAHFKPKLRKQMAEVVDAMNDASRNPSDIEKYVKLAELTKQLRAALGQVYTGTARSTLTSKSRTLLREQLMLSLDIKESEATKAAWQRLVDVLTDNTPGSGIIFVEKTVKNETYVLSQITDDGKIKGIPWQVFYENYGNIKAGIKVTYEQIVGQQETTYISWLKSMMGQTNEFKEQKRLRIFMRKHNISSLASFDALVKGDPALMEKFMDVTQEVRDLVARVEKHHEMLDKVSGAVSGREAEDIISARNALLGRIVDSGKMPIVRVGNMYVPVIVSDIVNPTATGTVHLGAIKYLMSTSHSAEQAALEAGNLELIGKTSQFIRYDRALFEDVLKDVRNLQAAILPGFQARPQPWIGFGATPLPEASPFVVAFGRKEWGQLKNAFGDPNKLHINLFRYPATNDLIFVKPVLIEADEGVFINPVLESFMNIDTDDDRIYGAVWNSALTDKTINDLEAKVRNGTATDADRLRLRATKAFKRRMTRDLESRMALQRQQYKRIFDTFMDKNAKTPEELLQNVQALYKEFAGSRSNLLAPVTSARLGIIFAGGNKAFAIDPSTGLWVMRDFAGYKGTLPAFGVGKVHARALKQIAAQLPGLDLSADIAEAEAKDEIVAAMRNQNLIGYFSNITTSLSDAYSTMVGRGKAYAAFVKEWAELKGISAVEASQQIRRTTAVFATIKNAQEEIIKNIKGKLSEVTQHFAKLTTGLRRIGTPEWKIGEWADLLKQVFGSASDMLTEHLQFAHEQILRYTGGQGFVNQLVGKPVMTEIGEVMAASDLAAISLGASTESVLARRAEKVKFKLPPAVAAGLGVLAIAKFFSPNQMRVLGEMPGRGGEFWDYRSGGRELPFFTPIDIPEYAWDTTARVTGTSFEHKLNKLAASVLPEQAMATAHYEYLRSQKTTPVVLNNRRRIKERFAGREVWRDIRAIGY